MIIIWRRWSYYGDDYQYGDDGDDVEDDGDYVEDDVEDDGDDDRDEVIWKKTAMIPSPPGGILPAIWSFKSNTPTVIHFLCIPLYFFFL